MTAVQLWYRARRALERGTITLDQHRILTCGLARALTDDPIRIRSRA